MTALNGKPKAHGSTGAQYMSMIDSVRADCHKEICRIEGSQWRNPHHMNELIDYACVKLAKGDKEFGEGQTAQLKDAVMDLVRQDIQERNQRVAERTGGREKFEGPALGRGL